MATILEQLLGLMSEDEKKSFAKKMADHPELYAQDAEASKLLEIYNGSGSGSGSGSGDDDAARLAAQKAETDRLAAQRAEDERKRLAATSTSTDSSAILAKLTEMNSTLDTRFKTLEDKMVKVDDLPKYREEMTATAIKASDDYAQVREDYRAEFGKPLDRNLFEKFINDQAASGVVYRTDKDGKKTGFQKALDAFASEERVQARVTREVDEKVKQKLSGQKVPGSSTSSVLSPAQQIIAKAKEKAAGGNRSNLESAISRLNALDRSSDDRSSGAVN